jgi:MYXO-CTERM domain-containing protein
MKIASLIAAAGLLAAAGAASAQTFNFGSTGLLDGFGATATQNFSYGGGAVSGFHISATMQTTTGFAYNSDMQLTITGPSGSFTVGPTFGNPGGAWGALGTGTPPPDGSAGGQLEMDFVTGALNGPGSYTVSFMNGYAFNAAGDGIQWDNVVITLAPVPTPASAALLGLGGLVALRRRR